MLSQRHVPVGSSSTSLQYCQRPSCLTAHCRSTLDGFVFFCFLLCVPRTSSGGTTSYCRIRHANITIPVTWMNYKEAGVDVNFLPLLLRYDARLRLAPQHHNVQYHVHYAESHRGRAQYHDSLQRRHHAFRRPASRASESILLAIAHEFTQHYGCLQLSEVGVMCCLYSQHTRTTA